MVHHTGKRTPLAVLALAAALASQAAGASEGLAQEAPKAQAQADDHSYLPPWMQPQANAGQASMQSQYLNALDDPALKQKAQAQKPRRRRSPFSDFFW